MVVIKLQGGLGNQLFQYSFGRIIAEFYDTELFFDLKWYSSHVTGVERRLVVHDLIRNFEIKQFDPKKIKPKNYILRRLSKNFSCGEINKCVHEIYSFDADVYNLSLPHYFQGYFQSYKYFAHSKLNAQNFFNFSSLPLSRYSDNILEKISNTNSVSVHIRRGDYLNKKTRDFHGLLGLEYYKSCIAYMNDKLDNAYFFLFSDDPEWVELNLKDFSENIYIVKCSERPEWEDLYLMSSSQHNVIANSSYSWWAAFLNGNRDKIVLGPAKWFISNLVSSESLFPEGWIKMSNHFD